MGDSYQEAAIVAECVYGESPIENFNMTFLKNKDNKLKYLAYIRKSTEEEDRQILSKKAQEDEIRRLFPDLDITFLKDDAGNIGESMSAAKPGRPVFNKMIEMLESGKYKGIVAWHPDRLSRNMPDASRIIWDIQTGVIDDLKFCNFTFEKTPEGIMLLQMIMSQAQYYSAKLSKDVKRGNAKKRALGQLTGLVPIGYKSISPTNNGRSTYAVPDPERFDIIQKAFRMYMSGEYSVPMVVKWLNSQGFLTPLHPKTGGKPLATTTFYKMLKNPRYAGFIPDPNHPDDPAYYTKAAFQPMITEDEYNKIQKLLGRKGGARMPHDKVFEFKGVLKCGVCGHSVTAERKKGHDYYHCTHKSKKIKCTQGSIRGEDLELKLDALLQQYTISDELYQWGLKALQELADKEQIERDAAQDTQNTTIQVLQRRLDNLLNLVSDGIITSSEYTGKKAEISKQLEEIQSQQAKTNQDVNNWYNIVERTLTYLCDANTRFKNGELPTKRLILESIGSNAKLTDGEVSIESHYWVTPIAEYLQGRREKVRTGEQQRKNSPNQAEFDTWCG